MVESSSHDALFRTIAQDVVEACPIEGLMIK